MGPNLPEDKEACPVCGSIGITPHACAFPGVLRCRDCRFIFAKHHLDSSSPGLYDEDWAKTELAPTFAFVAGRFVMRNSRKLTQLLDRLEGFRRQNRLLDVGCGAAFFLKLAKDRGWDVCGVEVSDFGVRFSRETLGLDVFEGTLQAAAFPSDSFDVVFNSHVLEHVGDPRSLVREMRRVLRPAGALVSAVPTQFSTPSYLLLGQMTGEGPPRHVSFFTRATFERLLAIEGFSVVYSHQNIEILALAGSLRRKLVAAPGPTPEGGSSTSPASYEAGPVIRAAKASLNWIGTRLNVGDELLAIAVKQ